MVLSEFPRHPPVARTRLGNILIIRVGIIYKTYMKSQVWNRAFEASYAGFALTVYERECMIVAQSVLAG